MTLNVAALFGLTMPCAHFRLSFEMTFCELPLSSTMSGDPPSPTAVGVIDGSELSTAISLSAAFKGSAPASSPSIWGVSGTTSSDSLSDPACDSGCGVTMESPSSAESPLAGMAGLSSDGLESAFSGLSPSSSHSRRLALWTMKTSF